MCGLVVDSQYCSVVSKCGRTKQVDAGLSTIVMLKPGF
jgi:hypothetical protein